MQVVQNPRYKDIAALYPLRRSEYLQKRTPFYRHLKRLIKRANVHKLFYRNPKLSLDIQSRKAISLLITVNISLNGQINNFVYHSDSEKTIVASFPSKRLKYMAIILFLQKLSTLTIAKITTSTEIIITLPKSIKQLRALTMCTEFTPDSRYDNSIIRFAGKCIVGTQCFRIYFVCKF